GRRGAGDRRRSRRSPTSSPPSGAGPSRLGHRRRRLSGVHRVDAHPGPHTGRVGDVYVGGAHVNQWLEQGLAFPAFYASMTREEILWVAKAAHKASDGKRNAWPHFSEVLEFDPHLLYRPPSDTRPLAATLPRDHGKVTMPKVFRRLATKRPEEIVF